MKTRLIIKFNLEGFHNWPNAPDCFAYLRNNHRHMFYWEIEIEVEHAERAVEIIHFRKLLYDKFYKDGTHFADMSCEQIAIYTRDIICDSREFRKSLQRLQPEASFELISVQVLEDNENGAKIYL